MTHNHDSNLLMSLYAAILLLCMQTLNLMHGLGASYQDIHPKMGIVWWNFTMRTLKARHPAGGACTAALLQHTGVCM